MPIDFVEREKATGPIELFNADSKARPQHLEGEVLPQLLSLVGEAKGQRLSRSMVEQYLEKNVLIFDPKVLEDMFKEADFQQEGSLDVRTLAAAIMGRYPKRKMTREWRQLVSLLLGIPDLVLTTDIVRPKVSKNGVFNAESVWTQEAPTLPPITRKRVKSADASASFQKPLGARGSEPGPGLSGTASGSTFLAPRGCDCTVLTAAGLRTTAQASAEASINGAYAAAGGDTQRSTFDGVCTYNDFSQGLEVASQQGLSPATASAIAATTNGDWPWKTSSKTGLKAWNSTLPPTAITLSSSALSTLRSAVQGTARVRPGFSTMHKTLTPVDLDLKKTLGQGMDVSTSMCRVEPTRPTHMPFNPDFITLGDYNTKCRTQPGAWYNEHPSLPAAAREPKKYPWGEWGVAD